MLRRTFLGVSLLFCMAAFCGSLQAQTEKTMTIRVLDGKTGNPVLPTGFLVRVDHDPAVHANWVVVSDDGTARLTVPKGASLLSIQGTYDDSTQIFFNCDSKTGKATPVDRWYAISEILTTGVVTPNGCGKQAAAKLKPVAKPGEFVIVVRRKTTVEQWRE